MTNFTGSILNQTYDLTKLITSDSNSIIDNPTLWLARWNLEMQNIGIVTFIYVFAMILFLVIRKGPEVKDSEALVYAGFSISILGIILFIIDTTLTGVKLISWVQLLPLIIITAVGIILNYINRNY